MATKLENLITNLVEPHKNLSIDIPKQRFPILTAYVTMIMINLKYF